MPFREISSYQLIGKVKIRFVEAAIEKHPAIIRSFVSSSAYAELKLYIFTATGSFYAWRNHHTNKGGRCRDFFYQRRLDWWWR